MVSPAALIHETPLSREWVKSCPELVFLSSETKICHETPNDSECVTLSIVGLKWEGQFVAVVNSPRQRAIKKALRALIPLAPFADFDEIEKATRDKTKRSLAPTDNAYLTTLSYIRHVYTDYDQLRDEGYDRDSARHFVAEVIEDKLREWGSNEGVRFND